MPLCEPLCEPFDDDPRDLCAAAPEEADLRVRRRIRRARLGRDGDRVRRATALLAAVIAVGAGASSETLAEEALPHAISATAQPATTSGGVAGRSLAHRSGQAIDRPARFAVSRRAGAVLRELLRCRETMWHPSGLGSRRRRRAPCRAAALSNAPLPAHRPGCRRARLGRAGDRARIPEPEDRRELDDRERLAALPARERRAAAPRCPAPPSTSRPAPETGSANPHTQISFLGAPASAITAVAVRGERSGPHAGALRGYSQGDGASFVPTSAFDHGERVEVSATVAGRPVSFAFRTTRRIRRPPRRTTTTPRRCRPTTQSFYTQPGMQAPLLTVTTPDRDPAAGDIFTTNGPGPGQYGPLIYTPQGTPGVVRRPARRRDR